MATSDDLPDAPWIRESWYTGDCPGYEETPYERCGPDDFVEGADADYGWRILAWMLDVDENDVPDDASWQDIWDDLKEKAKKAYCNSFQQLHFQEAAEMYNEYWRRWRS